MKLLSPAHRYETSVRSYSLLHEKSFKNIPRVLSMPLTIFLLLNQAGVTEAHTGISFMLQQTSKLTHKSVTEAWEMSSEIIVLI